MSREDKIVPITRGRGKPNDASFAVIAGSTRVDFGIEPAQPVRRSQPATVVPLRRPQRRAGARPYVRVSNRADNNQEESKK
jgi:hypothetical protein